MKITFRNGLEIGMGNFLDLDELNILKITLRNGLEKILQENLAGNLVGKSCGKILREILWKNLVGNLVGKSCGTSYRKILWEILAGNLAGNCCGKILRENAVGKCCGKYPIPISKPFLKVIFKICNSSRST